MIDPIFILVTYTLMKKLLPLLLMPLLACSAPREYIRIVGSSTLYPFVASAAEQFGRNTPYKTPVIEATGTGGGMKLFCAGQGLDTPDITNASRPIKESEKQQCAENNAGEIIEIPLGFDGIVIANLKSGPRYSLTPELLFLALAQQVEKGGELIDNPFTHWNQIDSSLPDEEIRIYGPPPTSGTRDAFVELVMEQACDAYPAFHSAYPEKDQHSQKCALLREDGHFIDAGENDNIIVQKLKHNERALGIFGYSFLAQNADTMQGATINGISPEFDRIASGNYAISRSLFIYVKKAHLSKVESLGPFLREITSEAAANDTGYMALKGLIPMMHDQRDTNREIVETLALRGETE